MSVDLSPFWADRRDPLHHRMLRSVMATWAGRAQERDYGRSSVSWQPMTSGSCWLTITFSSGCLRGGAPTGDGPAVVGTAGTADVAVTMARECESDVIVMDTDMPGMICLDAGQMNTTLRPDVQIFYLSATVSDRVVDRALQAGASGFVTKSDHPEMLVRAIRAVQARRSRQAAGHRPDRRPGRRV